MKASQSASAVEVSPATLSKPSISLVSHAVHTLHRFVVAPLHVLARPITAALAFLLSALLSTSLGAGLWARAGPPLQALWASTWAGRIVKGVLWAGAWAGFIRAEFGAVFLVVSLIVLLVVNTRTGSAPKGPGGRGQPSAYSVFNPNCERLDGTFTAEQFERELRYGPSSVN